MKNMEKVLGNVSKPKELKKSTTTDKSVPVVDSATSVKKVDRQSVETVDKSKPVIDPKAKVGKSTHGALLGEVAAKKK
jgi:hypothetical protein